MAIKYSYSTKKPTGLIKGGGTVEGSKKLKEEVLANRGSVTTTNDNTSKKTTTQLTGSGRETFASEKTANMLPKADTEKATIFDITPAEAKKKEELANVGMSQSSQLKPEEYAKIFGSDPQQFSQLSDQDLANLGLRYKQEGETVYSDFAKNNPLYMESQKHPLITALLTAPITSVQGAMKGASTAIERAIGKSAIQKSMQVGTETAINVEKGTAGTFAANTKTATQTQTFLTKAAATLKNPQFVVGTLMAAIGSYPFAGFIKEEALQTLGFATKTALDNGNIAGAEEALALQQETLNPDLWDKIKASVPFINVLDSLDNFYNAAQAKMAVDAKLIQDKKIAAANNETPKQTEKRIQQEETDDYKASIDYYNQERKKLLQWELDAKAKASEATTKREKQAREEEAEFWRKEREKQAKLEEEQREAQAEFWRKYKKEMQKESEKYNPSKLNFGLI